MKCRLVFAAALVLCGAGACWSQAGGNAEPTEPSPLVMLTGKDLERSRTSEIVRRVKAAVEEIGAQSITQSHPAGVDPASLMPWRWVLLNESEWLASTRIYGVKTSLAFGDLKQRVTYVRGSRAAAMSSLELKRLLAHELGHLVCACADEARADTQAEAILKIAKQLRAPRLPRS